MIFDHEHSITMYYDADNNYFVDGMGHVIENPYLWVTPNDLYLFHQEREDLFLIKPNNTYVEIIFPEYLPY